MEQSTLKRNKRARNSSSSTACVPLRCHVVDDHCDALKHIHAAIRRGALPFSGLHMMHWDAHPDLMVTPDLPAATCFYPRDLYDALGAAEGGIAEWILPMVFQGHLSKLWWIRPPWARQFSDGDYRFCVGQVKAAEVMRVSSMAPYFVDDQLYCPEAQMQHCKPLELHVSVAPEAEATLEEGVSENAIAILHGTVSQEGDVVSAESAVTDSGVSCSGISKVEAAASEAISVVVRECRTLDGNDKQLKEARGKSIGCTQDHALPVMAETAATAVLEEGQQTTPWVLDICLDYFTTENPFMAELELLVGKEDAALVRAFFERPLFRGASTELPHELQLEHERIFRSEVDRLLCVSTSATTEAAAPVVVTQATRVVTDGLSNNTKSAEGVHGDCANDVKPRANIPVRSTERVEGLQRLRALFDEGSAEDRLLADRFASMVGRMGPKEREMVAWTDHCACLPRYLATQEEVHAAVQKAEGLIRSLMMRAASSGVREGWGGRPGVVTIARSEHDGYVPADMAAFVEGEVLAMLKRLFDNEGSGGGLEVVYDEGLESKKE